jgi:hypothetical protein
MQPLERNRLLDLASIVDDRGQLVVIEARKHIPFDIERVYCVLGRTGEPRGFHAHRQLTQMLVCLAGSCRVRVDNGFDQAEWHLHRPDQGLMIRPMEWREMHDFSAGTVLMCLASAHYDEADYIRDYDQFLAEVRGEAVP